MSTVENDIILLDYDNVEDIYVDGAMNKTTGKNAWGSIVDQSGQDLVKYNENLSPDFKYETQQLPVGERVIIVCFFPGVVQQNNSAEMISLLFALRLVSHQRMFPNVKKIHSDSSLLVDYWSQGKINPKTRDSMDPTKLKCLLECAKLRSEFEKRGGKVVKVSGLNNLADLGYHKK